MLANNVAANIAEDAKKKCRTPPSLGPFISTCVLFWLEERLAKEPPASPGYDSFLAAYTMLNRLTRRHTTTCRDLRPASAKCRNDEPAGFQRHRC